MTYQPRVRTRARLVSHGCLAAAMAAVFAILGGGALAAADYPIKPVRVFVPYGPGGVGDLTMRLLADKLGEQFKQQFVIENRPGAGGIASAARCCAPGRRLYARRDGQWTGDQRLAVHAASLRRAQGFHARYRWRRVSRCCSRYRAIRLTRRSKMWSTPQRKTREAQSRRHQSGQHAKSFCALVPTGDGSSIYRRHLSHDTRAGHGAAARRCRSWI